MLRTSNGAMVGGSDQGVKCDHAKGESAENGEHLRADKAPDDA
jgi:hypothetical protein